MRKITDLAQTVSGLIIRRPLLFFSRGVRATKSILIIRPLSFLARGEGNRIHFNYPPPRF